MIASKGNIISREKLSSMRAACERLFSVCGRGGKFAFRSYSHLHLPLYKHTYTMVSVEVFPLWKSKHWHDVREYARTYTQCVKRPSLCCLTFTSTLSILLTIGKLESINSFWPWRISIARIQSRLAMVQRPHIICIL